MKKNSVLIVLLVSCLMIFAGCDSNRQKSEIEKIDNKVNTSQYVQSVETKSKTTYQSSNKTKFDLSSIPKYSGQAYVEVNNNVPYFTEDEYTTQSFERYSPLDKLGRCGPAFCNVGIDIMPTSKRERIGMIKPSGWHTVKYDSVDGKYLYNRCHLIAFQLSGENANERNLITGTRYMNAEVMNPFEIQVGNYVRETKNHVLYRVTPIFEGDNLLATGVLMEALSMEDNGEGICFNVFCYNEQPGIIINHADGNSKVEEVSEDKKTQTKDPKVLSYIANKNTKKFHYPSCESVKKMKEKNKEYLECKREEAVKRGYIPCAICKP